MDRARASFRHSFLGKRNRSFRLAGYLTPPSDITQEEEGNIQVFNDRMDANRYIGIKSLKQIICVIPNFNLQVIELRKSQFAESKLSNGLH